MSNEKFKKREMRVTEKNARKEGVSKKEFKKKSLIIGLIVLFVLALGIVGFALTNNGNNEHEPEEIASYEQENVEEIEELEEIEPINDIHFRFIVDEEVANRMLNTMSLNLVEREDTDRFYEFEVEDILEGIVVDSEDISDGVYYITSFRPPVTKDAELLVLNNLLKYDIEIMDGVPDLVEKPEITCCIDVHNCEDYYCAYGECAVECLVEREYDEELMYINADGEMVVYLPLVIVPVGEQTDEELTYVINEVSAWLSNNHDADQGIIDRVESALENAIAEQEYREQANVEDDEDDAGNEDANDDTVQDGGTTPPTQNPPNNPPADGGQGGGGTQPPAQNPPVQNPPNNPPACNHNWVANGSNQTQTLPGTWVLRFSCNVCWNFSTHCETTIFEHSLGCRDAHGIGGWMTDSVYQPGGTTTVWVPDGTYNCSICGVRR